MLRLVLFQKGFTPLSDHDDTPARLIVVAEYSFKEYAKTDFHDLRKNENINQFVTFNAALVSRKENGEPDLDFFEASTVRGGAIGLAAGAMVGLVFPPAALGALAAGAAGGLFGAAAGGLIGHLRHGANDEALKALAEALPEGKSAVVVSTTDLEAGMRIQTALAGADAFYTHVWDGDTDLVEAASAYGQTGTEIADAVDTVETVEASSETAV